MTPPTLFNPYRFAGDGDIGGWKELGRTKLGADSTTITVAGLDSKPFLMVMTVGETNSTNADHSYRFNGSGATDLDYSERYSFNGGNGTFINQAQERPLGTTVNLPFYDYVIISNASAEEKLMNGHGFQANTAGASDTMTRNEYVGKYVDTSAVISQVQAVCTQSGAGFEYLADTEVLVLGYDPTDADTGGFFEELANVDFTNTTDTYDTGAFDAKKYLFFAGWVEGSGATELTVQVNGDTSGSNYTARRNNDGTEGTFTSDNFLKVNADGTAGVPATYMYGYIANLDGNEKLFIMQQNSGVSAGTSAPRRAASVGKWITTGSQITSLQFFNNSTGDFTAGQIAVWGSD